jgi:hypothetical protein
MTDTGTSNGASPTAGRDDHGAAAAAPDGIERGELVAPRDGEAQDDEVGTETITAPAKVMRIGSMVKQLLDEVKGIELDQPSRERLAEIYERSVSELATSLSPDLAEELRMLTLPFGNDAAPSTDEIRIAQAQLVGWLEGLFHGIQATLFAQQLAARQQLDQMRQLPPGMTPGIDPRMMQQQQRPPSETANDRPGTYL